MTWKQHNLSCQPLIMEKEPQFATTTQYFTLRLKCKDKICEILYKYFTIKYIKNPDQITYPNDISLG